MTKKILLCLAILLLSFEAAWAFPVSVAPTFYTSSGGESPHTVAPYGTATNRVVLHNVSTNTNSPMSYSNSGFGYTQTSSADPLGFKVDTVIAASQGVNYSSVDGVATWFVLTGPGTVVSLTADIIFQGQIKVSSLASPSTATAAFTNYLSFVSSTASTEYDYLIVQNGVVCPQSSTPPTLAGTVPAYEQDTPGIYELNEVIRSKAFEVTVGTPFRLALVLNTSAGTNTDPSNFASIDFDPGFFGDGFALADGTPLDLAGYSIRPVPIPPSVLLLGPAVVGLLAFRRKRG